MKQKFLSMFLTLVMAATVLPKMKLNVNAACEEVIKDSVVFGLNKGTNTAMIKGVSGDLPERLRIPEKVVDEDGIEYVVNSIGNNVFVGRKDLKEVEVPDSVAKIGQGAFLSSSIEKIKLPNSVECIGNHAFSICENLTVVKLSENLKFKHLANGVFLHCKNLERITIPSNIETIGEDVFCGSGLKTIELHNGIKEIGNYAFRSCKQLTTANLPSSLIYMGISPFDSCCNLKIVKVPVSMKKAAVDAPGATKVVSIESLLREIAASRNVEQRLSDSVTLVSSTDACPGSESDSELNPDVRIIDLDSISDSDSDPVPDSDLVPDSAPDLSSDSDSVPDLDSDVFAYKRTRFDDNGFSVESKDGKEFKISSNDIIINQAGIYYVTGYTSTYRVIIRITDKTKTGDVKIVLNNASIRPSTPGAGIGVDKRSIKGSRVILELPKYSTNEVSGCENAGILNESNLELKIVGTVGGSLTATGGTNSAGIGGGNNGNGTNITITDKANIVAKGGKNGAGIGGGNGGNGINITISGQAIVKAIGGDYAAGIGGGSRDIMNDNGGNGTNITIFDHAMVTAIGGGMAAGIGGGCSGGKGIGITISNNAVVKATGGERGAGIGGGDGGNGSNIKISGDVIVEANGGAWGAGIGDGLGGNGSNITISGDAKVNAIGGNLAAGIGGGYEGKGSIITISDNPHIYVHSGEDGVGIGSGASATGKSEIKIYGGIIRILKCKTFSDNPALYDYESWEVNRDGKKYVYPNYYLPLIDYAQYFEMKLSSKHSVHGYFFDF